MSEASFELQSPSLLSSKDNLLSKEMVRGCAACERALRKKQAEELKLKTIEAKKLRIKEN